MESNFIDEMLMEIEAKEELQTEASYDLMLLAISEFSVSDDQTFRN